MCLTPIPVSYVDFYGNKQTMDAPCGKCIECVIDYQNTWKCRLIEEDRNWPFCYFFTLTYSDDHLPEVCNHDTGEVLSTACKKDVQLWLKRFRQRVVRQRAKARGLYIKDITKGLYMHLKPRFSYFICAEYGPNGTHRPHYHGLIFTDMPYREVSLLIGDWRSNYGYVDLKRVKGKTGAVNKASAPANYVAKYCCKGEFSSRSADIEAGLIEKAWRIMSKGIGSSYIERCADYHKPKQRFYKTFEDYVDCVVDRLKYFDGQYSYKLPAYYKRKLFYTEVKTIVRYYDKNTKTVKTRQATRLAARSRLSLAMQANVRNRIDEAYRERLELIRASNPTLTDSEVVLLETNLALDERESRKRSKLGRLNKFYIENKIKYKHL